MWYASKKKVEYSALKHKKECPAQDYEPFVLLGWEVPMPLFDERVRGHAGDRRLHFQYLRAMNYRFWVHPDAFVVHLAHPPPAAPPPAVAKEVQPPRDKPV